MFKGKVRTLLILVFTLMVAFSLPSSKNAFSASDDSLIKVWEKFITTIEKHDTSALNEIVSADASEEFLTGISAQMKSRGAEGIDALKNMKFVKIHHSAADIAKLGFEVANSKSDTGEFLWVVLKNENGVYKIHNFEPTYSLKFYNLKLKPEIEAGQSFKSVANPIVESLKKRLKLNKLNNFNFSIDYEAETIMLEISGLDSKKTFTDFISARGKFSLNRVFDEKDTGAKNCDELFDYPYFAKKALKKYKVSKDAIVTNAKQYLKETELTFSGLHVPQVQIDLNNDGKVKLESYTAKFEVAEAEQPVLTLACVLDYKVLSTFKAGSKISSGRIWVEDVTLVQTANMLNAIIGAGPLACPLQIVEFSEK